VAAEDIYAGLLKSRRIMNNCLISAFQVFLGLLTFLHRNAQSAGFVIRQ